jgi:Domain of unknown function (DUF4116)
MDLVGGKIAKSRKRTSEILAKSNNDVEDAICYLKSESMDLRQVLDHYSNIGRKREFWEAFLFSKHEIRLFDNFHQLVVDYATTLLEDRDLVLKLCAYNVLVYFHLSDQLKRDEGVLEAVLAASPQKMLLVAKDIQRMYPALVASALKQLPLSIPGCRDYAQRCVDESLWAHRNIALAWALAGGHFLDSFPEEFNDDEELLVAFLHHQGEVLLNPTPRLLGDKQFMLKAIKAHLAYLQRASDELIVDRDVLLAAMTNPRIAFLTIPQQYDGVQIHLLECETHSFWIDNSKIVRDKLKSHEIFVKLMLGGMMASTGGSTPLTLLNQGKETSLAFTKPIADYLGVPTGEELRMLREARKNLALMGIHWDNSC